MLSSELLLFGIGGHDAVSTNVGLMVMLAMIEVFLVVI